MPTEQVRLSSEAIEALRSYAPTHPLSTAILLMHKEVTTSHRPIVLDRDYWSQFEEMLKKYWASPKETKVKEFQPASTIKTIGKIDEEDKIQEPVGRQGRAL